MKVEKLLGLLYLVVEECNGAQLKISLHHVNFTEREEQSLSYCDTLDREEALVQSIDSITAELEAVINIDSIMYQGSCVYDGVFAAKVLHNAFAFRSL